MATDDMEDKDQILEYSMKAKLHTAVAPWSRECCIFRVPEVLRRLNKKAYEPYIVAIGPYHRNKRSLQPMEDVKKWYLKDLLSRLNMSLLSLIKGIKESETCARACYQERIDDEFMEIMILDGCFLIELFRKKDYLLPRSPNDPLFNMACMRQYLKHDLLLLENQLPWLILQKLFDLTKRDNDQKNLVELVLIFFRNCFTKTRRKIPNPPLHIENLHILHLIRNVLVSSHTATGQTESGTRTRSDNEEEEVIDGENLMTMRRIHVGSPAPHLDTDQTEEGTDDEHLMIPCVTRLLEAGVKFKKFEGSLGSIVDIEFTNGLFKIPPLLIHELTEPMLRNVIAFEQCYCHHEHKITSYAVLMDNLINTGKDVEYLVEASIIHNWLNAEDVSQFFNRIYNDTLVWNFYHAKLFKSVNMYYRTTWHKWRATLMREYFTSPWTIISLMAAIILLVLTFLQTFYSIKQS